MTTTAIITDFGTHTIDAVDCLLDTMIDAQNNLDTSITWTDIHMTHAHGTYTTTTGATRRIAVIDTTADPTIKTASRHWVAAADQATTDALTAARTDLHSAVAITDDPYAREQYCRSAIDYAATVLVAPNAQPSQRDTATCYLEQAQGMIDTLRQDMTPS